MAAPEEDDDRCRYPKSVRLRRAADFRELKQSGRRVTARHVIVLVRQNGLAESRFGLAVSKKVGNAVVRNRVKRWLREAIRQERHRIRGKDVLFIAKSSAAVAGLAVVRTEVADVISRLDQP